MTTRAHPVTIALALALGAGWFGFPGLLWDVAWHRTVGRDSFLSPPHVLMYTGVAVNGLVSAWALLVGRRRHGAPRGFVLSGAGFLLALAGAALDEWWHANIGKDVNLWSPPHLVGLAGTVLIAVGLVFALAAHTRYALEPRWRAPRIVLVFCFADLVHKAMVALDHYTLDAWGRTPDFYPFLLALCLPAVLVMAVRALGAGAATATVVAFSVEHVAILAVLLASGMRIPTLTPLPILPAIVLDLAMVAFMLRRAGALVPVASGAASCDARRRRSHSETRWETLAAHARRWAPCSCSSPSGSSRRTARRGPSRQPALPPSALRPTPPSTTATPCSGRRSCPMAGESLGPTPRIRRRSWTVVGSRSGRPGARPTRRHSSASS